jgi:hypothetical protein
MGLFTFSSPAQEHGDKNAEKAQLFLGTGESKEGLIWSLLACTRTIINSRITKIWSQDCWWANWCSYNS